MKYHSAVASSCMHLCTSDTYNIGKGVWVELPAMSCEWVWEGGVGGGGVGGATCNVL